VVKMLVIFNIVYSKEISFWDNRYLWIVDGYAIIYGTSSTWLRPCNHIDDLYNEVA
jgi:hypothetical protein